MLHQNMKGLNNLLPTLSNTAPSELKTKATLLQTKAEAFHDAANAIVLAATAGNPLTPLQEKAIALAKAAGKQDTSGQDKESLYYHATALSNAQDDHAKAIAVIEAFKTVKAAYDNLATQPKYRETKDKLKQESSQGSDSPEQTKVKDVEEAWKGVKNEFNNLCKALIKQFADQVETQATELQRSDDVENAQTFKTKYDTFEDVKSTIQITGDTKTSNTKTIEVTNLPHINDLISAREYKFFWIIVPSIITQWFNFLTYVILKYT